ncbi:dynactin subunit 1 [Hydra vulgaris]|uniref:Dynactin subunit 1 n=1 Tax=Hydra vulgaris TaxID=6087 RepID=T2MCX3_HYDVU|nr:dynactin subunit 1 [Hydra vulgaris]
MAETPAPGFNARVGMRVEVIGKDQIGTICYVGMTAFAAGKWVGVALDEPNGKNDGSVQGKKYFDCSPNHGIFVRQTQLAEINDQLQTTTSGTMLPSLQTTTSGTMLPSFSSGILSPRKIGMTPLKSQPAPQSGLVTPKISSSAETVSTSSSIQNVLEASNEIPVATPVATSEKIKSGLAKPKLGKISNLEELTPPKESNLPGKPKLIPGLNTQRPSNTQSESSIQVDPNIQSNNQRSSFISKRGSNLGSQPTEIPETTNESLNVDLMQKSVEPTLQASRVPSEEFLELQRKLIEKEKANLDLEEKLNVLKQKRIADQNKIKEIDKIKMQNQQLLEYKAKWQESTRELQMQIKALRNEANDADNLKGQNELNELQEAVEMATLDKEMAEEKYESLLQEHEHLKEKHEEVTLELEILKNEISEGGVGTVAANAELKQMEQQNIRLKEALIKLKDIAQNDKSELSNSQKENKSLNQKLSAIASERDTLQEKLRHMESQVDELKEQVDFALGAEEMVEKLTDKNLELEEKIEQYEETIKDLEALRELNTELEEGHIMTEQDLREELELADKKIDEYEKQLAAHVEQISDYQSTILKFRELVQNLQNCIKELQSNGSSSQQVDLDSTPVPDIDFKTKIKQYKRIIELELNKYHVKEANKQIQMVHAFLPDHFTKRGGDFDGICLLLLLERLRFKCELLSAQLHEKHDIQDIIEEGQLLNDSKGDQASHACLLAYNLAQFYVIVSQFMRALYCCDVGTFMRASAQYPELAVHEKMLDNYIELLSKDLLDDTVSIEVFEKTINQYMNIYKLHLGNALRDCTEFLADSLVRFNIGSECVSIDIQRLKGISKNCKEGSSFVNLIHFIELKNMELKQFCRKIRRRMVQDSSTTLSYPDQVVEELLTAQEEQGILVKYMQDLASVLSLKASQLFENEFLLPERLMEAAEDCVTLFFKSDDDPMDVLSKSFHKILSCLSGIALKLPEGDYDTEPEKKRTPPYLERAAIFKDELSSSMKLENIIEQKDQEILHIKRNLKIKSDDLSEANIRISLLEKRADNAAKEADIKVEQMAKKLEATEIACREKTKQSEKTMDALQSDIDALENERSEMRKKLEILSKKTSIDMSRTSSLQMLSPAKAGSTIATLAKAGVAGASPSVQVVLKDSPVFLAQMEGQKKALEYLQTEYWSLKCEKMKNDLASLPKPYIPNIVWKDGKFVKNSSDSSKKTSQSVLKECNGLYQNLRNLSAFPKVVDITKGFTKDGLYRPSPEEQLFQQKDLLFKLSKQKDELSKKVQEVITEELVGGVVHSYLRDFVSPQYSRLNQEKISPVHVATLRFPVTNNEVKPGVHNVTVTAQEFMRIHEVLIHS